MDSDLVVPKQHCCIELYTMHPISSSASNLLYLGFADQLFNSDYMKIVLGDLTLFTQVAWAWFWWTCTWKHLIQTRIIQPGIVHLIICWVILWKFDNFQQLFIVFHFHVTGRFYFYSMLRTPFKPYLGTNDNNCRPSSWTAAARTAGFLVKLLKTKPYCYQLLF